MVGIIAAGSIPDRREEVVDLLRQPPGEAARDALMPGPNGPVPNRWTLRTLRVSLAWMSDYTLSGVWSWLHRHHIHLRSAHTQPWSPDPEYASKREALLSCLGQTVQKSPAFVLLFLDEMGYYRWPVESRVWWSGAPDPAPIAGRAGENNLQWRIIGGLNALTGQVLYLDNYIVGRRQVIQMYQQIAQAYPQAERIFVVQDNWSVHRHADVLAALQAYPQIEPVWLPTYAPWLNPIEKLWRWLRQDVLKMHRWVQDHAELRRQVRAFLDQFAQGSPELLRYVGLQGDGLLAQALLCP